MSRADEIYRLDRQVAKELKNIQESKDINLDTIMRFYTHSVASGLSLARIKKILYSLRKLSRWLDKRFEDATKEDIVNLVAKVERSGLSQRTIQDFRKFIKQLYKWIRQTDDPPPEVRWIKAGELVGNSIAKKDLLTVEEVDRIIENARDIQDKALFSVLFDSGRRLGEILGLRIGDVEFDSLGARLSVDGKVGKDIVRICASAPRLAIWMDNHPSRSNPSAPLWIKVGCPKAEQRPYSSVRNRLEQAVARAGIKKRVWAYLFRHSRITPASTRLTYAELCHVFGWKQGSDMPHFYVHLSGDDRDNAFLKMNGLPMQANGSDNNGTYAPVVCPRCKRTNSPDAKYCNGCGLALNLEFAVRFDQTKDQLKHKIETLTDELVKSPEVVDALLQALSGLREDS